MSYPSVKQILENQNISLENADEVDLKEVLWQGLQIDLPLGINWLTQNFSSLKDGEELVMPGIDPNSELGKQLIRIVGCDLPRSVAEEKLNIGLAMYNCCKVVGKGGKGNKPSLSFKIQLQQQLTPDC